MSVAVAITGALRTFELHPYHLKERVQAVEPNADYFFCLSTSSAAQWNSKGGKFVSRNHSEIMNVITHTYKPIVLRDVSVSFQTNEHCHVSSNMPTLFDNSHQTRLDRLWETLATWRRCFSHITDHEHKRQLLYDSVWRLRPDIFVYDKLPQKVATKNLRLPTFPRGRVGCNSAPCINDHVAFLPRWSAARYFTIADEYLYCRGNYDGIPLYIAETLHTKFHKSYHIEDGIRYTLSRPDGLDCARVPRAEQALCSVLLVQNKHLQPT